MQPRCSSPELDSFLQADDLLKEADELLAKMAQGHLPKKSQPSEIFMEAMPRPGYQLQCDVNGCTIIPVSQSEASQAPLGTVLVPLRISSHTAVMILSSNL